MSAASPIAAVAGATGRQGGATVRALLQNGGWRVRALTRDPSSSSAAKLVAQGVDVVRADFDDVESLKAAFAGATAVFGVTDFWAACGLDAEKERAQGVNLVDAAKAAGVKHFVWSTLEDTRPMLKGLAEPLTGPLLNATVPHFDAKAEVNAYAKAQLGPEVVTSLYTSIFYENFLPGPGSMAPNKSPDGTFTLFLPLGEAKTSWCSTDDIGNVAGAVIAGGPAKYGGKDVPVVGEEATLAEIAATFSDVFGKQVVAVTPPQADWVRAMLGFGVPEAMAHDLANMYLLYEKVGMTGIRPPAATRAAYPGVQGLRAWLEAHREQLASAVFA